MSLDPVASENVIVSDPSEAESIEAQGCPVVLSRTAGREATELYVLCRPPAGILAAGRQAEALYRALAEVLAAEGGNAGSMVSETVFLRHLQADILAVRDARHRVLGAGGGASPGPATTEIEQPPLDRGDCLQVLVHAVIPKAPPLRCEAIYASPGCECAECVQAHGLRVTLGSEIRFHIGGLCGAGANAYEQTLAVFGRAEQLLQRAGLAFRDVVRTWIYLRDIDRDYPDLNRARRAFFEERGIDPVPASTGIGGAPVSGAHDLCLGLYAVKDGGPARRHVMTSPTLNEAMSYGADFVRGMKVTEANRIALHVSGTASIDADGRTAHVGDFESQADRMLVNIAALLEGQGADFSDVVSATTYQRDPANADRLKQKLQEAGFTGFPNAMVAAPICRPDLLCEIEALAVLPKSSRNRGEGCSS
jgi:enamine deaminase RidA (YjgF/YER057c/UK114 family)